MPYRIKQMFINLSILYVMVFLSIIVKLVLKNLELLVILLKLKNRALNIGSTNFDRIMKHALQRCSIKF